MNESPEIKRILTEIRDVQREQLAVYQRVTQRSLELQEKAVKRQEQVGNLYRRIVLFGFVLIAFVICLIVYLLTKLR